MVGINADGVLGGSDGSDRHQIILVTSGYYFDGVDKVRFSFSVFGFNTYVCILPW